MITLTMKWLLEVQKENDSLYSLRLWLNMAYAPDENNVFKGQLSMNKAFGAKFDNPMNSSPMMHLTGLK